MGTCQKLIRAGSLIQSQRVLSLCQVHPKWARPRTAPLLRNFLLMPCSNNPSLEGLHLQKLSIHSARVSNVSPQNRCLNLRWRCSSLPPILRCIARASIMHVFGLDIAVHSLSPINNNVALQDNTQSHIQVSWEQEPGDQEWPQMANSGTKKLATTSPQPALNPNSRTPGSSR